LDGKIPFDAFNLETIRKHGLQVLPSGDECNGFSRVCQATTKVTSNTTSSKNYDVHNHLPKQSFLIVTGFDNSLMNRGNVPQLE
jgi:hypothetical protein